VNDICLCIFIPFLFLSSSSSSNLFFYLFRNLYSYTCSYFKVLNTHLISNGKNLTSLFYVTLSFVSFKIIIYFFHHIIAHSLSKLLLYLFSIHKVQLNFFYFITILITHCFICVVLFNVLYL